MLGLQLPTDPRWVTIVESNIDEILTDHAWCEQKAASNAISLMVHYPEYSDLVEEMVKISQEEMAHFGMVHARILARGKVLGRERRDEYVNDLLDYLRGPNKSRVEVFVDKLLFSAMIEARSCERFRVLSENIQDPELAEFYRDLMISEANHYTTFITLARKYGVGVDVDTRWKEFLKKEAEIIARYGKSEKVHG